MYSFASNLIVLYLNDKDAILIFRRLCTSTYKATSKLKLNGFISNSNIEAAYKSNVIIRNVVFRCNTDGIERLYDLKRMVLCLCYCTDLMSIHIPISVTELIIYEQNCSRESNSKDPNIKDKVITKYFFPDSLIHLDIHWPQSYQLIINGFPKDLKFLTVVFKEKAFNIGNFPKSLIGFALKGPAVKLQNLPRNLKYLFFPKGTIFLNPLPNSIVFTNNEDFEIENILSLSEISTHSIKDLVYKQFTDGRLSYPTHLMKYEWGINEYMVRIGLFAICFLVSRICYTAFTKYFSW